MKNTDFHSVSFENLEDINNPYVEESEVVNTTLDYLMAPRNTFNTYKQAELHALLTITEGWIEDTQASQRAAEYAEELRAR